MKQIRFPLILGAIYAGVVGVFFVDWGPQDVVVQKLVYLVAPLTSLIAGFLTLNYMGWKGKRATNIKLVMTALSVWFVGESLTLYQTWKNIEQYPSIVDVCFWIGYILFALAVILEAKLFDLRWERLDRRILMSLLIAFICIVGLVSYFGFIGYKHEETFLVNIATISWSIGDLITGGLGLSLLAMVWEYRDGAVKRAWIWFVGATMVNLFADTIYNVYPDAITDGSILTLLLDSMWVSAYFLFAGYFLEIMKSVNHAQKRIVR